MYYTKHCRHCKSEINKKAKVCPICKRGQSGWISAILFAICLFLVFPVISISVLSGDDDKEKENQTQQQEQIHTLGETASVDGVSMTLNSITESGGGEFSTPSDGYIFLACDFTIDNISNKDMSLYSYFNFEAYCNDFSVEQSFDVDDAFPGKTSLSGDIAIGKKMNGIIIYEVPADWKSFDVYMEPNVFSSSKIKFRTTK